MFQNVFGNYVGEPTAATVFNGLVDRAKRLMAPDARLVILETITPVDLTKLLLENGFKLVDSTTVQAEIAKFHVGHEHKILLYAALNPLLRRKGLAAQYLQVWKLVAEISGPR